MRKIVPLLGLMSIALFLSACGPSGFHYNKAGINSQQEAKDVYECRQEATYYTSSASVGPYGGNSSSGPSTDMRMGAQCLAARGYTITWAK